MNSTSGLRTGLVIVDHQGYIFTPTALYLEADHRAAEAPNAMRLSEEQVKETLARLSPAAKAMAARPGGSSEPEIIAAMVSRMCHFACSTTLSGSARSPASLM